MSVKLRLCLIIKSFMPKETLIICPLYFVTLMYKLQTTHNVYKNLDSSNKVDLVDCTVVECPFRV